MQNCLITFMTQTHANRFRSFIKRHGFEIMIIQVPKEISYGGCSYGAVCRWRDVQKIVSLCRENGVTYSRVWMETISRNGNRQYEEIKV